MKSGGYNPPEIDGDRRLQMSPPVLMPDDIGRNGHRDATKAGDNIALKETKQNDPGYNLWKSTKVGWSVILTDSVIWPNL